MSLYITPIFNPLCSPPGMSFITEPLSAFILPRGIYFRGNYVLRSFTVLLRCTESYSVHRKGPSKRMLQCSMLHATKSHATKSHSFGHRFSCYILQIEHVACSMLQIFTVVFVWPHHATKSQENVPNDVRKRSNHVRISLKLVECLF